VIYYSITYTGSL